MPDLLDFTSVYYSGWAPPRWSTQAPLSAKRARACRVFYDVPRTNTQNTNLLNQVKRLMYEREPVNIAMDRQYHEAKLEDMYGHSHGCYGKLPPQKNVSITPPNVVLYTHASVKLDGFLRDCHILHAIGLAFDSKRQPDYKIYNKLSMSARIRHARSFYKRVFLKLYEACRYLGVKTVVLSLVGANNFAKLWWDDGMRGFQKSVWLPAFEATRPNGLTIKTMGVHSSDLQRRLKAEDIGFFPACMKKVDLAKTAFVNAWDCWSVPGNGNANDNSLDGYMGRVSNIGVLGTAMTNKWLRDDRAYIGVKVQGAPNSKRKDINQTKKRRRRPEDQGHTPAKKRGVSTHQPPNTKSALYRCTAVTSSGKVCRRKTRFRGTAAGTTCWQHCNGRRPWRFMDGYDPAEFKCGRVDGKSAWVKR